MNWKHDQIMLENVDFSRPAFNCVETLVFKFWIEECVEAMDRRVGGGLRANVDQLQIIVDHL